MAITINVYTQSGEKSGTKKLNDAIFAQEVHTGLMHQAFVRQMANARHNISFVKNRSAVSGGGRKPYRQKGTGRARQGTVRAPQFRGGGVVFGPTANSNYSLQMPKKQRRKALFSALSSKIQDNSIFSLKEYSADIKTKTFSDLVAKLPVERNVLFIIPEKNEKIEKSARNLGHVKTLLVNNLNIADIMKYRKICLVGDADVKMAEIFLK